MCREREESERERKKERNGDGKQKTFIVRYNGGARELAGFLREEWSERECSSL